MSDAKSSPKETAQRLVQRVTGWGLLAPGEVVRAVGRLDRRTLAWGSLGLAALLMLSFNLAASLMFRNVKADLTADQLFTISDGTRTVLTRLDEPITVRIYYTRKLGEVAPLFAKYFERVKALLEQYRDISGNKLVVTFLDPDASPDAEDRAVSAGLKGVPMNQEGDRGYFGLVASNMLDNDAVVEFFTPERERFLEYDLTKLINGLSTPKKRVVGLISGLNIEGGFNPMQPMRQPPPAWTVIDQIREFFEVRSLEQGVTQIPVDVDVLMIVQPIGLTADAAYAIDQYVLGGGRVVAFVDPHTESSPLGPPGMLIPANAEMARLLKTWGLQMDDKSVVGDPRTARQVQFTTPAGPTVTEYLAWLGLDKSYLNEKDLLSGGIDHLNFATAGILTKVEGATTTVQPIVLTSSKAGPIDLARVRAQPNPIAIQRQFTAGNKPLMIAARVSGEIKTAFPEGRPKPPEKPKDEKPKDDKGAQPKEKSLQEKIADRMKEAKEKQIKELAGPDQPHRTSGRVNAIVVADADVLADRFWVEVRDFLGQRVAVPNAHNATFVINALEQFSGGAALADLRGRGISERPFERVNAIKRASELRFRQKAEGLAAKLKDLEGKLSKLETRGGGEGGAPLSVVLTEKDKQAIETFRAEMVSVRRELKEVKAALRQNIDRLHHRLRFINIAVVPMLIGLGGLGVALLRRRRNPPAR